MAVYFITAPSEGLVKIGFTDRSPERRLGTHQVGSPVRLELAHVDEWGDRLTEAELHYRYKSVRSHGEWFSLTNAIRDDMAGNGQERWYVPDHLCGVRPWACGAVARDVFARFGIPFKDYGQVIGSGQCTGATPLSPKALVALFHHLRRLGHDIHYHDLCARPREATP